MSLFQELVKAMFTRSHAEVRLGNKSHEEGRKVKNRWFHSDCFGGSGCFVPIVSMVPVVLFRWFRWSRSGVPGFSTCPKRQGSEKYHVRSTNNDNILTRHCRF